MVLDFAKEAIKNAETHSINFDELRAIVAKKTAKNKDQCPLPFVILALMDKLSLQKKSAEHNSKLNFPVFGFKPIYSEFSGRTFKTAIIPFAEESGVPRNSSVAPSLFIIFNKISVLLNFAAESLRFNPPR